MFGGWVDDNTVLDLFNFYYKSLGPGGRTGCWESICLYATVAERSGTCDNASVVGIVAAARGKMRVKVP